MCERRIRNNCEACIPARFPQGEPALCIMIRKEHMSVRVVTQMISRGDDEKSVTKKREQDCELNAAQDHAGSFSVIWISIRFGLRRFSNARLKA